MVSNEKWFGASAGFYPETINQSLRFEDGNGSHLIRTPSSAGNRKTFTWSAWIKRSNISTSVPFLLDAYNVHSENSFLRFNTDDTLRFSNEIGSSFTSTIVTNQVFRDINWYHIVLAVDTTQSTASDRVKMYVNGEQITSFSSSDYPSLNENTSFNNTVQHTIGRAIEYSTYFDGYMAEVNFVDGTAYTPTTFGETKNGVWIPKGISGVSYGTNGYRLTFADSSNLGDDTSGNGNDFTSSGFNSSYVVIDVPNNNFPTLNSIGNDNQATFTKGNLQGSLATDVNAQPRCDGNFAVSSGKWYWEVNVISITTVATPMIGIKDLTVSGHESQIFSGASVYAYYSNTGNKYNSGNQGSYGATYTAGDIIGVALDLDAGTLTFYKNGSSQGTAFSSLSGEYTLHFGTGHYAWTGVVNFGQDGTFGGNETAQGNSDDNGIGDFYYSPPSGHLALCSSNLPDTTIAPNQDEQGSDFNQVVFYNGNSSNSHQITGVGFKPDMVHIKARNQSASHYNIDSRRGIGTGDSFKVLGFNTSIGQYSAENDQLRSLDADGFTLDDNTDTTWYVNRSSDTYNSWNWRCGSDTPTKTFKVKVVADSTDYGHGTGSNKYQFLKSDGTTGFGTNGIDLDLTEGGTYVFDWSDSSAQSHPIRFSLTNDGTHSSGTSAGSEYTTGVVKDDSSYLTTITLPTTASGGVANLFYYCQNHSGMGAEINTNPITQKGETNFDGTVLSVTQVNNDIGMSIATYTAPSGTFYFGHGLSKAPEFFMVKSLGGTGNWIAYHKARTPSVPNTKGLYVNSPSLPTTGSNWIQEVSATRIGITTGQLTGTGDFLLYAWHSVDGYCKVGQYEGRNSTDNAFVYTGFLPNIIWIKNVDSGHDWIIRDLKHSGYYTDGRGNPVNIGSSHSKNNPHTGGAGFSMDFLSNGFKIRHYDSDIGSAHTFMYIAWATDQTFKFSNAR